MKSSRTLLFPFAAVSTLTVVVGSFVVDLNGDFPHLTHRLSLFLSGLLFLAGTISTIIVIFVERRRRYIALVLLAVLAILACPAFFR